MKLRYSFIILAAAASCVTGCGGSDDKKDDPKPTTGTVKGSFTPAASGSQVFLIKGTDTTKTTPTSTGTYEFTSVKAGDYSITVKPKADYGAPTPVNAAVTAGQTTEVPAITLTALPVNGVVSVKMGGINYSGTPYYVSSSGDVKLAIENGGYTIYLYLPTISGPGTFTTVNNDFEVRIENNSNFDSWYTFIPQGSGTLTVTSYNAVTKKGNATFSFSAPPSTGSPGTKVGTDGVLTNVKMKY